MKKKILFGLLAVIMCVCLVGCGNNNSSDQEHKEIINNAEENKKNDDGQRFTITSDDTKYVVTNGTSSQVFYHEGETITGYALYIDYDDAETAKRMYDVYKSSYENQDTVKKLSVDRNYLIVEYVDDYIKEQFGNQTLSNIKAVYDTLNK